MFFFLETSFLLVCFCYSLPQFLVLFSRGGGMKIAKLTIHALLFLNRAAFVVMC